MLIRNFAPCDSNFYAWDDNKASIFRDNLHALNMINTFQTVLNVTMELGRDVF